MKNTFGSSVSVTLFGESHGEYIGAVLDGISPGIEVDHDFISVLFQHKAGMSQPSQFHTPFLLDKK